MEMGGLTVRNDGVDGLCPSLLERVRRERDRPARIAHIVNENHRLVTYARRAVSREGGGERPKLWNVRTLSLTSPTRTSMWPSNPGASPDRRFRLMRAKSTSSRSARAVALFEGEGFNWGRGRRCKERDEPLRSTGVWTDDDDVFPVREALFDPATKKSNGTR